MPRMYSRLEVKLKRELMERLRDLKREVEEANGKHVSMGSLVSQIIESYIERLPADLKEEK